jgi:hypothetical protein
MGSSLTIAPLASAGQARVTCSEDDNLRLNPNLVRRHDLTSPYPGYLPFVAVMVRCSLQQDHSPGIARITADAIQGAVLPVVHEVWPVTRRSPRPCQRVRDHAHEALQRLGAR